MGPTNADQPSDIPPDYSPAWLSWPTGIRVMVRRRLPESASHLFTDVLGEVVTNGAGALTLKRRDESQITIPWSEIAVGKPIPPPPPRRHRMLSDPTE